MILGERFVAQCSEGFSSDHVQRTMRSLSSQSWFETPPVPGEAGAGDREEGLEDEGFGDFGDSLLRRICLDAVAVGEYAPFGKVRPLLRWYSQAGKDGPSRASPLPPFSVP